MIQQLQNMVRLTGLITGLFILAACSSNPTTAPAASTSSAEARTAQVSPFELSTPAGPLDPARATDPANLHDIVALAFDPTDGSLLKGDRQGLARWQPKTGWESVPVAGAPGLTGLVINPTTPGTLYIAGPGLGVSRSDNGGASWRTVNTGLPSQDVTALAMHSLQQDTLYTWISSEGIYRTEDGGATWEKVPEVPIADPKVIALTHSTLPGSMNTGWLYAATPSGAYLSMD
jgi:hypothetical protein